MSIQEQIETYRLQIKDIENTKEELLNDPSVIPRIQPSLKQGDKRCPKRCERWDGGNLSCRHHCDLSDYSAEQQQRELRNIRIKQHIQPLNTKITNIENQIIVLQEKAKLPLLRQQLLTATTDYQKLSPNYPEFRQKQIDSRKSLYEKATKLDTLERKHNLFGNLPTIRTEPEIIEVTPEPITVYKEPEIIQKSITIGTEQFDYKKLGIIGVGIFAALAFIIWRLK